MLPKNLLLFVIAFIAFLQVSISAQNFSDDFEAYTAGESIMNQSDWGTWDAAPAADTTVSSDYSVSGDNSLLLTNSCDIVKQFVDVNSGIWIVKANVFVSSAQIGTTYFLLLNTYADGGPYNWSVQLSMNPATGMINDDISGGVSMPLVIDDWAEIKVVIDFDHDTHTIYYNGEILSDGASFQKTGQLALQCVDLYSDGSTGYNETYIDDFSLTKVCVPVDVERIGETDKTVMVEGVEVPLYAEGDTLSVSLELTNVRDGVEGCPDLGDVTITENLPEGWIAENITMNGVFSDGVITWQIPATEIKEETLSYDASGPVMSATINIQGSIKEEGNEFVLPVRGVDIVTGSGLKKDGEIVSWLLLGPFMQSVGSPPLANNMQMDFLTDDEETYEEDVMPKAGDFVETDFTAAASTGLAFVSNPDINPDGIPEWFPWREKDNYVDLQVDSLYGEVDNVMCYAVCYVCADEDMTVTLSAGSDDAIQILHDDNEVWINPIERAWPGYADVFAVDLHAGVNRIMAKIFEKGGGWVFGVKMTDGAGEPITGGVTVTLDPNGCGGEPVIVFKRGDINVDGSVNLADAIALLSHLFGGAPPPACLDAADSNDDGQLNLADAINILSYLFAGGAALPAPFNECGPDPTNDDPLVSCDYLQDKC